MLFILTVVIFDPTSITYKSNAEENYNSVNINERAIAAIDVPIRELPICVKRISYIPEVGHASCLVSIECVNEITSIHTGCEVNQGVISCYETNECSTISFWIDRAEQMCDC